MKKNNRDQYLKTWLTYLKGKTRIDPKALAEFLGKSFKGALSATTMKRYNATIIANLYENGFLAGKTGKTFAGSPLEITREITPGVLDKCLTSNYKKVKFTEPGQPPEPVEAKAEPPAAKKPKVPKEKKPAKKPVNMKAVKPVGQKSALPKKKIGSKSKNEMAPKARKTPGRKPAVKKPGLIGRKTDLLKMGEGAFLYSLELTKRVEEMEKEIAGYQRVFEAIRELFGREIDEMEEWLGLVLE